MGKERIQANHILFTLQMVSSFVIFVVLIICGLFGPFMVRKDMLLEWYDSFMGRAEKKIRRLGLLYFDFEYLERT